MRTSSASYRWLLTGLIGFGVTPFICQSAHAQARDARDRAGDVRNPDRVTDRNLDRGSDVVEPTSFDRLPDRVRRSVDDLRKDHKVVAAFRIHRNGQDMYRLTIQRGNSDRVILLTSEGTEVNIEDIRPSEMAAYRENPDQWYRDYDDRMMAQQRVYSREAERVTATVEHPERIDLDRVPAPARASLIREAGGDTSKLAYIVRYRDTSGNVLYQCSIPDSDNTAHMVQITPDGRLFNEGEFKNNGQRVEDWRPRTVGYEDLPDRVRQTIDREAPRGRIPHVDMAKRRGQNIYTIQVDERDRTRYLTVNEDGKVLSDVSDRIDDRTRG